MNIGEAVAFTGISDEGSRLIGEGCLASVRYGMGLQRQEDVQRHLVKLAEYITALENKNGNS